MYKPKKAICSVFLFLLFNLMTLCAGATQSQTVDLVLDSASLFNDDLTSLDNWELVNGATGHLKDGVLTVKPKAGTEEIALKMKDSIWQSIGSPTSYYVEMLFRPTGSLSGNKNIGIASNIQVEDNGAYSWYYAGFNSNGRMQAGYYDGKIKDTNKLKGYQNSGDGTSLASKDDYVYYKWRYEYNNGTINFYCNDLYMGKNSGNGYLGKGFANYKPAQNFNGSIGIYTCGGSFEIAGIRIGRLNENQTKLILETTDASLPRLWGKYLRLIENTSSTRIRMEDKMDFTICAVNADGAPDDWEALSTNPNVLAVSSHSGASGETLTIVGVGTGTADVIIQNASESGSKRKITFFVDEKLGYVEDAYTGFDGLLYPTVGAEEAYPEGELTITFDTAPKIVDATGEILIHKYDDDTVVDTIKLNNAAESAFNSDRGCSTLNIGNQMVRMENNTLYITPHFNALDYETKYYITIPNEIIYGTLNGTAFTGFSPKSKTWSFSTKQAPKITGTTITVDGNPKSGADFQTVQKALKYVSDNNVNGAEIQIAPGIYRELLTFKKDLNLTLKGMGTGIYGDDVVIQYTNGNNMNGSTSSRALAYFASKQTIRLINLTLRNTGQKSAVGQAETIYFNSDTGKLIAENCSFKSQQDTILTKGYNWFYQCYVEGNTDFIWGYAQTCLFEECKIQALENNGNHSVIFQARCPQNSIGYVLLNCEIHNANTSLKGSYFARSSGKASVRDNISVINCQLTGNSIISRWYNKDINTNTPDPSPQMASVSSGWKQYGLTDALGNEIIVADTNSYTLTEDEYLKHWSNRSLILGSDWLITKP